VRDAFFFLSLAGLGLSVADRQNWPGRSVAQTGLLELALFTRSTSS